MMNKIREGYKETEIGVIPEDWEALTVEKISVFVKDGSHGSHKDVEDGIPLLSAKDIIDNTIKIPTDCRKISISDYNKLHKNYELQIDDVLITIVGTIGRTAIVKSVEKKFTLQRSVGIVRPNNLINAEYLKQFMSGKIFQNQLKNSVNASAQGGVYLKTLSNLTCFVPQLPEQQRIAEILSTTDSHIEKLDKVIEDYQLLKKGMMKKLLTEGIGHTEFKETEIGRIPKEWVLSPIFNTGQYINGKAFKPTDWEDSGTPIIRIQNLSNRESECNYYNGVIEEKYIVNKDDILFSWSGTLGVYRWHGDKAYLNQHIYKVVPNQDIDANYLMFQLDYAIERMAELSHGSTMKHITKKNLETFLVAIPSIEEQTGIATVLTVIDLRLNQFIQERKDYLLLKSSMMELLLTGKVRVNSFEV